MQLAIFLPTILTNLFFGLIFYKAGDVFNAPLVVDFTSNSTNPGDYTLAVHFGAVVQIAISGMFGAVAPMLVKFPLEAALFKREYGTRTYGVGWLRSGTLECGTHA